MNTLTKTELVNYDQSLDQIVVSSKEVAEHFEKRHDHVLRDIENLMQKDSPNFGEMFFEYAYEDSYGRKQKCYLMNRDGFSLLVMGFTGDKALEWKLKYIEAFNMLERECNSPEKIMARALQIAERELSTLRLENKEMKPKALFADAVSASHTSILIGDMAKLLKQNGVETGQKRLFEWLRENGYLMKTGSSKNMPTQRAMELGLFEVKESTISNPDGSIRVTKTTKVTGKGQVYFTNLFLERVS